MCCKFLACLPSLNYLYKSVVILVSDKENFEIAQVANERNHPESRIVGLN